MSTKHRDQEIIEGLLPQSPELAELWQKHLEYEKQLEDLQNKPLPTPEDELEIKRVKKLKLAGRDRIEALVAQLRQGAGA